MSVSFSERETPLGKQLKKQLEEMAKLSVNVGFQAGDAAEDSGIDVVDIAAWNEFGNERIPARPFMRDSFDNNKDTITKLLQSEGQKITDGTTTAEQVLTKVGMAMKGLIQNEIREGTFKPLKKATIERKGSSKPLIDTGTMRQSVNYVVKPKEG